MKTELTCEELSESQELIYRIACGPDQGVRTAEDVDTMLRRLYCMLTGEKDDSFLPKAPSTSPTVIPYKSNTNSGKIKPWKQ